MDFVGYADNFKPDAVRATPDPPYVREVAKFVGTDHTDITLATSELAGPPVRAAVYRARDVPIIMEDIDSLLYLLSRTIRSDRRGAVG